MSPAVHLLKGMVFTTDAIFALVIVTAAVAIITYFNYSVQAPLTATSLYTQSVLTALGSVTPASLAGTDKAAQSMLNAYNASGRQWTQYQGGSTRQSYAPSGPEIPTVQFIFPANAPVSTPIVAGSGSIYFAAGNTLYSLNASRGTVQWTGSPAQNIAGLSLHNNMLLYYNSILIGALYLNNGTGIWQAQQPATQILVSNNRIFAVHNSGSDQYVYMLNAQNGSLITKTATASNPTSATEANGSIIIPFSSGYAWLLNQFGGNVLASSYGFASTNISAMSGTLYVGSNTYACGFYLNLSQRFCYDEGVTLSTVAAGNGTAVYGYSGGLDAVSPSGASLWQKSMSAYGSAVQYPIITNGSVYSIWSGNYVIDQSAGTGSVLWSTQIPGAFGAASQLSDAYGDLYVAAGGNVIAYGACTSQAYSSLLQNAVQLYLEGRGSCATYLADKVQQSPDSGIFINGSYAPSLNVSSFNGANSYIQSALGKTAMGNNPTISLWFRPAGAQSTTGILQVAGSLTDANSWILFQRTSPTTVEWYLNAGYRITETVNDNAWYNLVLTYNGVAWNAYKNGQPDGSYTGALGADTGTSTYIGNGYNGYFNGMVADVQVYNITLNSTQALRLYNSGISGAPVAPANIVGWWPLEGDANDYSGYNNTGYPIGVTYAQGNYLPSGYSGAATVSVASALVPFNNDSGFNGANSIYANSPRLYKVSVYSWK